MANYTVVLSEEQEKALLSDMASIQDWINKNQSEFDYQDYDSDRSWYDWEEVGEEWEN